MKAKEMLKRKHELIDLVAKERQIFKEKIAPFEADFEQKVHAYNDELEKLSSEAIYKAFVEDKMYLPMSELKRYEGKVIDSLYLVLDNGEKCYLSPGYGMKAKGDKLICLGEDDYNGGFWEENGKYFGYAIEHAKKPIRPIGFYNVTLFDTEKFAKVEERRFSKGDDTISSGYSYKDETTTIDYLLGEEEGR